MYIGCALCFACFAQLLTNRYYSNTVFVPYTGWCRFNLIPDFYANEESDFFINILSKSFRHI